MIRTFVCAPAQASYSICVANIIKASGNSLLIDETEKTGHDLIHVMDERILYLADGPVEVV